MKRLGALAKCIEGTVPAEENTRDLLGPRFLLRVCGRGNSKAAQPLQALVKVLAVRPRVRHEEDRLRGL